MTGEHKGRDALIGVRHGEDQLLPAPRCCTWRRNIGYRVQVGGAAFTTNDWCRSTRGRMGRARRECDALLGRYGPAARPSTSARTTPPWQGLSVSENPPDRGADRGLAMVVRGFDPIRAAMGTRWSQPPADRAANGGRGRIAAPGLTAARSHTARGCSHSLTWTFRTARRDGGSPPLRRLRLRRRATGARSSASGRTQTVRRGDPGGLPDHVAPKHVFVVQLRDSGHHPSATQVIGPKSQ